MKKILTAVSGYPDNNGGVALMYVHVRNKYYTEHKIDVTVLNFAAKKSYVYDGIKVITKDDYKKSKEKYDVLILHAANIRNHYLFLKKYEKYFNKLIFFFHGHEVMKINKAYPQPYKYMKKNDGIKRLLQDEYDNIKLMIWRYYLPKVAFKSKYIFVSEWFYKEFEKYVGIDREKLHNNVNIIYNCVGNEFENLKYSNESEKKYDFISIRSYLDESKYCMDIINRLAINNPQFNFLVIGKGKFYLFNKKPDNIVWIDKYLNHNEIIEYLNMSKCALLPTRLDAQGVMMCEFVTYGMPLITSNLEVCREVLHEFDGVRYIDNNNVDKVNLVKIFNEIVGKNYCKNDKFLYAKTVKYEEDIIEL